MRYIPEAKKAIGQLKLEVANEFDPKETNGKRSGETKVNGMGDKNKNNRTKK